MPKRTGISAYRLLGQVGATLTLAVALFGAASGGAWAQSSAPVDNTPIIIGANNTGFAQLPLSVADDEGFFKKAGLDVTVQMLSGGTPSAMAAFSNGSVNIVNLSAPEIIQYIGNKVTDGKGFGEIVDQTFDVLAAKSITNIQQMKGSTIGISGPNSGDWIYFVALLQHYGIDPKDVTFITAGNPVNRLAAIAAGTVQFAASTNNSRPQASAVGNILLKSGDSPVQFPGNLIIANKDLLTNHKPLLKKFLAAIGAGIEWMQANPDLGAAECAKVTGGTIPDCKALMAFTFDRTQSNPYTWSVTSGINVDGIKSALAVMATVQPNTKGLTVDDVVDTSIAGTKP